MLKRIIRVSLIVIFYLCCTGQTGTYYVDQNHSSANDTNPGTLDLPWLTIQHAAETLIAGDTVYIRTGTYNERIYINNEGNSTDGYIVFSAYPGEVPVIDGTGVIDSENGLILDKAYIKLLGLEIRNWSGNGIWIENAAFLEISDCVVHDVFYGIGVADGTHDFVFNRVEVHHFDLYGFDVSPSGGADCYNGIFNNCVSHTGRDPQQNVDGYALGHGTQHNFILNHCIAYDVYDGFDISSRNTALNGCLAYNCSNGCYKLWQDKIKLENCVGYNGQVSIVELDWDEQPGAVSLMNCTFFNSQTYNVWIENAADTLKMTNCILVGGDNICLSFEQRDVKNYKGDYNIFQNDNANRTIVVGYEDEFSLNQIESGAWTTYSGQDAHSLVVYSETDLFVDPSNFDLRLLQTSPAVDKGTGAGAPPEDYDGHPRPSGEGYDIGAYEYQYSSGVLHHNYNKSVPATMNLLQNYPNPFNPNTTFEFELPVTSQVTLKIFNPLGEEMTTLVSGQLSAGSYKYEWYRPAGIASGVYLYRLEASEYVKTRKMVVLR